MAKRLGDLMVPMEKYIKDGEEKTRWQKIGVLLETDKGIRGKIDCIPLGVEAGGLWFSCFEPRDGAGSQPQANTGGFREPQQTQPAQPQASAGGQDDIPF